MYASCDLPEGVSHIDVKGNEHADKLAGNAAQRACVPLHVSASYLYHVGLVKRIQNRITTILINLPHRHDNHIPKVTKPQRTPLEELISSTSHVIYRDDDRIGCARCHNNFHIKDPGSRPWLTSQCTKLGSGTDRPIPIPYEEVHIGNKSTHHSHSLFRFKGLVYCNKCGTRGSTKLHKLGSQCQPPTQYGEDSLKALRAGRLPPNCTAWPADL